MEYDFNNTKLDVSGFLSVKFANGQTLDDFCAANVADYNRDRFEALAIRVFVGDETIITVYAVDKTRQEVSTINTGTIPVKKFKITTVPLNDLFTYCEGFNCTLSTGNYNVEDMEVINK